MLLLLLLLMVMVMMMMISVVRRFLGALRPTTSSQLYATQPYCRDLHVVLDRHLDAQVAVTSFLTLNYTVTFTSLSGDVVSSSFQVLVVYTRDLYHNDDDVFHLDYHKIGIDASIVDEL